MSDQVATTEQPPTRSDLDPATRRIPPEVGWLIAAVVVLTGAVVLVVVDQVGALDLIKGAYSILAGLLAVCSVGYFARTGETRVARLMDKLLDDGDERERRGYARGYVDGVAGNSPASDLRRLRSVQ